MEPWPSTSDLLYQLLTQEPKKAGLWNLPSFLTEYTLHDSCLEETRLLQGNGLLVLINWDMHWNQRVRPQYRNLVIFIAAVYSVNWTQGGWKQNTLSGANSQRVSAEDRHRMLDDGSVDLRGYQGASDEITAPFDDEELTRTTFELMNWSRLTVLHGNEVRLLCLDDDGTVGAIPGSS